MPDSEPADQPRAAPLPWLRLAAFAYGLTFWRHPAFDPDLGWQLLGGNWVRAHGGPPLADFVNSFNPYWHDYHWLAQLALYELYRLGGYALLKFAFGVLMGAIGVVLVDIVRLAAPRLSALLRAGCVLSAMTLIYPVMSVRPQVIALLGIALAVRRLQQRVVAWELPYLFAMAAMLVNVHVSWVFLPLLWGLYRCAPRLVRTRAAGPAYAWGGLTALAAAGLVSPYGLLPMGFTPPFVFMNYALVAEYAALPPALRETITEMRSVFGSSGIVLWLLLLHVGMYARAFRWQRVARDLSAGLATACGMLLAARFGRMVAIYAILSLPYLARTAAALARPWQGRLARWDQTITPPATWLATAVALIYAAGCSPWSAESDAFIDASYPIAVCRHLARSEVHPRPPRAHVRVLTHFNDGGWCRWVLHQERPEVDFRVTTDGRTQGVPVQHYLDSFALFGVKAGWLQTLRVWNPDALVVPKQAALAHTLLLVPGDYRLVFHDEQFALFVPVR